MSCATAQMSDDKIRIQDFDILISLNIGSVYHAFALKLNVCGLRLIGLAAPACTILTFAWTISSVCRDYLGTGEFVADAVANSGIPIMTLAPIIFIIAALLSFATGTAWGTFGILIPIVISICSVAAPSFTITCLSATLAGSVFGDHCSPISDTTILSSTGSQCS